jgi:predicted DNA binding CopG/RHH family protein
MAKYNPIYLNAEEKALLKDIEGMDSRTAKRPSAALQARLKKAAREYIAKEAKMNIRIASSDLAQIKARAMDEGLKYQTFVKSVLHKYVTGQLVEKAKKAG